MLWKFSLNCSKHFLESPMWKRQQRSGNFQRECDTALGWVHVAVTNCCLVWVRGQRFWPLSCQLATVVKQTIPNGCPLPPEIWPAVDNEWVANVRWVACCWVVMMPVTNDCLHADRYDAHALTYHNWTSGKAKCWQWVGTRIVVKTLKAWKLKRWARFLKMKDER